MDKSGNFEQLLASLNRLVAEDAEPMPSNEDRIKKLEESQQGLATNIDEVKLLVKQILEVCFSQGQAVTKIYYRGEAASKDNEAYFKDIKDQLVHLSSQLQSLVQPDPFSTANAQVNRPSSAAQLSPMSTENCKSPDVSAPIPGLAAEQSHNT
ncbi:hypothetical protein EDC05_000720, partial [Coemansia umbellata]